MVSPAKLSRSSLSSLSAKSHIKKELFASSLEANLSSIKSLSTKSSKLPSKLSSASFKSALEKASSSHVKSNKANASKLLCYDINWLDHEATKAELRKYVKYDVGVPISQEDQLIALMEKFPLTKLRSTLIFSLDKVGCSTSSIFPMFNANKKMVLNFFYP